MSSSIIPVWGKVYLLTCDVNGKQYVGQTTRSLKFRFKQHLSSAKKTRNSRRNTPLSKAIRKHGKENFSIAPLCSCISQDELNLMEDLYIVSLGTIVDTGGYNLERGGSNGKSSEATKALQSSIRKGKDNSRYRHDIEDKEIIDLYEQGYSTIKIAETLSMSNTAVGRRLRKAGVTMRPVGRHGFSEEEKTAMGTRMSLRHAGQRNPSYRSDILTEELVQTYQQGVGTTTIAKRLGVADCTVRKRLIKAGVTMREVGSNQFSKSSRGKEKREKPHRCPVGPSKDYTRPGLTG